MLLAYNVASSKLLQTTIFLLYLSLLVVTTFCSLSLNETPFVIFNLINVSAALTCLFFNCVFHKKILKCYKSITQNATGQLLISEGSVSLIKSREIVLFFLHLTVSFQPKNSLTSIFLHFIAYVIPYVIITQPRILHTYINYLLYKKATHLNTMLQSIKSYKDKQVLHQISKYHFQICHKALKLQRCLKVQIALVYVKAFQDILTAFYAVMRYNGDLQVSHYVFRGILAVFELFLLIYPVNKTIAVLQRTSELVSANANLQENLFLLQCKHLLLKPTVHGLFALNNAIFLQIIQAASTYLVIILQEQPQEN